jgi:hypothetical protein
VRTLTTQESQLLSTKHFAVWPKVEIDKTGAGSFQDMGSLEGWDWVKSIEFRESIDDAMPSGTLVLHREIGALSVAPLMTGSKINTPSGSYAPLLDVGRRIKISVAMTPQGTRPSSGDYQLILDGEIDDLDEGGGRSSTVTVRFRGKAAAIADRFIETTAVYGSSVGVALQTVIQQILDANLGGGVVTLYTPSSPGWSLHAYQQMKEPTLDAVRKLVQQIGWDLRYKWRSGTAQFELTLYQPDRSKVVPDRSFTGDEYYDLARVALSRKSVRNAIRVVWTDAATGARTSTIVTDATSITDYGRRYMEVAEDAASNIDSTTEATSMANAILADLKEPTVEAEAVLPLFYAVELGDLYRFAANGAQFDSQQDLAVVAYSHRMTEKEARTSLSLRGKPSGGYKRWLAMEARPGIGASTDLGAPATPSNVAVTPALGGLEISYDEPTDPDWYYSEFHISTSSGFTPSEATKVYEGRSTTYFVAGLVLGTTYYVKVIAVDKEGNKSTASTQVLKATNYVGTVHHDLDSELGNAVPNGDFGHATPPNDLTTMPPDEWESCSSYGATPDSTIWDASGTGAAGKLYYHTSNKQTGPRSLYCTGDSAGPVGVSARTKRLFPVTASRLYAFEYVTMCAEAAIAQIAGVLLYQSDQTTAAGSLAITGTLPVAANTWHRETQPHKAASTARWARAYFGRDRATGTTGSRNYVDRIGFYRSLSSFRYSRSGALSIAASGAYVAVTFDAQIHDHGSEYSTGTGRFTAADTGDYSFDASVALNSMASGSLWVALYKNGAFFIEGPGSPWVSGYTTALVSVRSVPLLAGDYIDVRVFNGDSVARNVRLDSAVSWFSGHRIK